MTTLSPITREPPTRVTSPAGLQTAGVSLTPRQYEVLALSIDYYQGKQIADRLGICPARVHECLRAVAKKFKAHSRGELLRRARLQGIGS